MLWVNIWQSYYYFWICLLLEHFKIIKYYHFVSFEASVCFCTQADDSNFFFKKETYKQTHLRTNEDSIFEYDTENIKTIHFSIKQNKFIVQILFPYYILRYNSICLLSTWYIFQQYLHSTLGIMSLQIHTWYKYFFISIKIDNFKSSILWTCIHCSVPTKNVARWIKS